MASSLAACTALRSEDPCLVNPCSAERVTPPKLHWQRWSLVVATAVSRKLIVSKTPVFCPPWVRAKFLVNCFCNKWQPDWLSQHRSGNSSPDTGPNYYPNRFVFRSEERRVR